MIYLAIRGSAVAPFRRKAFPMTETTEPKSERVDLRMTPAAKRTLQRAAAVAKAVAFLELVEKRDHLARQTGDELMASFCDEPTPIGAVFVTGVDFSARHG